MSYCIGMTTKECKPQVDRKTPNRSGPAKYDVNWETVTWPEFHTKYPNVPKSSYYTYRADAKPITPEAMPVVKVNPQTLTNELKLSEIQKKICQRIANGESETHACESEGIPIDQHLMWLSDDKSTLYSVFVKKCLGWSEKRTKDKLVDSIIAWKDRQWTASAWYLERKYPAEFGKPESGARSGGNASVIVNLNVRTRSGAKDITTSCNISTQTPESGAIVPSQEPQEGLQDAG